MRIQKNASVNSPLARDTRESINPAYANNIQPGFFDKRIHADITLHALNETPCTRYLRIKIESINLRGHRNLTVWNTPACLITAAVGQMQGNARIHEPLTPLIEYRSTYRVLLNRYRQRQVWNENF